MSETHVRDRRRHRRYDIDVPITLDDVTTGGSAACSLRDISRIGASAYADRPIDEMSIVGMDLTLTADGLPDVRVRCKAAVVRCDSVESGRYELGLYFMDLAEDAADEIDRFIDAAAGLGFGDTPQD